MGNRMTLKQIQKYYCGKMKVSSDIELHCNIQVHTHTPAETLVDKNMQCNTHMPTYCTYAPQSDIINIL